MIYRGFGVNTVSASACAWVSCGPVGESEWGLVVPDEGGFECDVVEADKVWGSDSIFSHVLYDSVLLLCGEDGGEVCVLGLACEALVVVDEGVCGDAEEAFALVRGELNADWGAWERGGCGCWGYVLDGCAEVVDSGTDEGDCVSAAAIEPLVVGCGVAVDAVLGGGFNREANLPVCVGYGGEVVPDVVLFGEEICEANVVVVGGDRSALCVLYEGVLLELGVY